ncbi:c-type cytochrome [Undibacterium sp. TJN25]|uniref:c-type cytochrome n=1 Tax=Undibacterium sp. TJN25 TaxID=3413056 RepID=UPI003BF0A0BD
MKKNILLAALLSATSFAAFAGGDVDAGKAAVAKFTCASCHGADFKTPIDPSYPKLAGQNQDYLAHALKSYQRGADGPNGRGNAIMGAQAKALNDSDIENIAAYLHTLPGTLVLKK